MTTGMSAPPIEAVMCRPSPPESVNMPASAKRLAPCERLAQNSPMQPNIAAPAAMFIMSLLGSERAAEERFSLSLPKATIEPVAVTPPMTVARATEPRRTPSRSSG